MRCYGALLAAALARLPPARAARVVGNLGSGVEDTTMATEVDGWLAEVGVTWPPVDVDRARRVEEGRPAQPVT